MTSAETSSSDDAALPPMAQLALGYVRGPDRAAWDVLFALDAKLAGIVRSAREPMLARIRLAWWRERLGEPVAERPRGQPLLGRLADWGAASAGLAPLVDGWDALVSAETLAEADVRAFAGGRAAAIAALAAARGVAPGSDAARMAEGWALADLAAHTSAAEERALVQDMVSRHDWQGARLPRALRPLAVLHGLAARTRGERAPSGLGDLLATLRLGTFGR